MNMRHSHTNRKTNLASSSAVSSASATKDELAHSRSTSSAKDISSSKRYQDQHTETLVKMNVDVNDHAGRGRGENQEEGRIRSPVNGAGGDEDKYTRHDSHEGAGGTVGNPGGDRNNNIDNNNTDGSPNGYGESINNHNNDRFAERNEKGQSQNHGRDENDQPEDGDRDDMEGEKYKFVEERPLFDFPAVLKRQLVDDWEFVTKDKKLVPLPREPNVQAILNAWLATRRGRGGQPDANSEEVAEGLRVYFDAVLGKLLLYRFERSQYNSIVVFSENKGEVFRASTVYGGEHLLRMIAKLPSIFNKLSVSEDVRAIIIDRVDSLIKFMVSNGKLLFLLDYVPVDQSYILNANETG